VGGLGFGWEQEKLEARKMLENGAESHQSAARFVRPVLTVNQVIFLAWLILIH
jgi:hypothetical protein